MRYLPFIPLCAVWLATLRAGACLEPAARSGAAGTQRYTMEVDMRGLSVLLRLLCVAVLSIGLGGVTAAAGSSGTAKAAPTRP
ncbi:hypothetical protein NIIDMKKI_78300 [Mycobacterium kansasii]|uniref:Uncharacterized protein n=1 Tax=Mycobacterium kansasii TaxID=1768 RepID=A0A7G1IQI5_MYCKA|nr:hypothetical protein NIIDMKKI_78300 [Mycobacterium kansasii]